MFSESPLVKKLYERLSYKVKAVSQDIENKVQNAIAESANVASGSTSENLNPPTYLDEMLILQTLKNIENKAKDRLEQSDKSWK